MPQKLRRCIELHELDQAVTYYLHVAPIIREHSHLVSFQPIQHECDTLLITIKQELYAMVTKSDESPERIVNACLLLLKLGDDIHGIFEKLLNSYVLECYVS